MNNGSIAGLVAFLFFVILYYLGFQPTGVFSYFGIIIPMLMLIYGVKKVKKDVFSDQITFGIAFQSGLTHCLIYASMFAMSMYLFSLFAVDNMVGIIYERTTNELEILKSMANGVDAENFDESSIEKYLEILKGYTLRTIVWQEFSNKLFGGLFLSLIVALIMKTKGGRPLIKKVDQQDG